MSLQAMGVHSNLSLSRDALGDGEMSMYGVGLGIVRAK